ncbi:MAG: single-stranded-DNA-specific exonuclease RecJ [Thermoguttaceae bacterium]
MRKRSNWKLPHYDATLVRQIVESGNVSAVVAQILLARGVVLPRDVQQFLNPKLLDLRTPESLPGCLDVAQNLKTAIENGERITVCGDYDVDGMTATAILVRAIRQLGGNVGWDIPSRHDGYGLSANAVNRLAEKGTQCIITVDCGISANDAADAARALSLRLLITDHHAISGPLPWATAIAHPDLELTQTNATLSSDAENVASNGVPVCGACVAFKVAWGLGKLFSGTTKVASDYQKTLVEAIAFAAIGTVADVMPLVGDNRALVRHGLEVALRETTSIGLHALLEVCGRRGKTTSSEDIAFQFAPRLNAAGRMGQEQLGVELLLTDDAARARELAVLLDELNTQRRAKETQIIKEAHKQIKSRFPLETNDAANKTAEESEHATLPEDVAALVLYGHDWPAGIIGIVAGRITEEFHRPTVVLTGEGGGGDKLRGSARSIAGVSVVDIFKACEERCALHSENYEMTGGGHAMAAGLTLPADALDFFRETFTAEVAKVLTPELMVRSLNIDAEFTLSDLTSEVVHQIEQMRPFGAGNRRPLLMASGVVVDAPPVAAAKFASVVFRQASTSMRCVAFGSMIPRLVALTEHVGKPLDIVFHASHSQYRRETELQLVDWRQSEHEA